ncbi:ElaB/YqjD/DUF883 family membrane-anchored ribosome-binding protein [Rhodoligotrophos appendicifer]|uniref:hypothetical protein n=1 Tax=Rhodoligotrophos appendicifer TaxID=987056 RepID=UPI001186EFAB|nr:hypothetical protein [Rhodoligotrophos appendicifer]
MNSLPNQSGGKIASTGANEASMKDETLKAASDVKNETRKAASDVKNDLAGMGEDLKAQAGSLGAGAKQMMSNVQEQLTNTVEEGKNLGAERVRGVAEAVRRAAKELESEIPQAAHYVRYAADHIESVSDAVADRNIGDLFETVQDFARRQPTAFLGIAALSGFALVRFLKTSAPSPRHREDTARPYDGQETRMSSMPGSQPASPSRTNMPS